MSARKELRRLLAEAKARLDAYEEYVRKLEEAGEQPVAAEVPPSGPAAAEERDDTVEGLI